MCGVVCSVLFGSSVTADIYTSERTGSDETGQGTAEAPFKTVLRALHHAGREPFPAILVDGKEEGKVSLFSCLVNC